MKRLLPLVLLALVATAFAQQPVQSTDGVTGPVKVQPANTTPGDADKALTVALSPNSSGFPVNAPGQVQKTSNTSSGSVASLAKAYTSNLTQGNTAVVSFCNGNNAAPTAPITDTLGLVWFKAIHAVNGTAFECDQWFAFITTGGADTVTVTPGGTSASIGMEIYELSGFLTVAPVSNYEANAQPGTTQSNSGTSATASTTDISPSGPNHIAIAVVGVGTAAQTITAGAGWTNDSGQLNPTTPAGLFSMVSMSQYLDNILGVTPQATFTSEPWVMAVATYKPVYIGIQGSVKSWGRAANALPTAANNADSVHEMVDTAGRVITRGAGPRELLVNNNVTLTTTGASNIIAAQGAGIFADLTFLECSNTSSTATRIDISDGTRTYSWFLAASGGGFNINFNPPLKATTANTNWTSTLGTAVTDVRCGAQAVQTN